MTVEDLKNQIELMLGAPILEVEVSEQIEKIIAIAFREINQYIDTPNYTTISTSGTLNKSGYDLSEYNVRAVLYVARGSISLINSDDSTNSLLWSPLSITMNQNYNYNYGYGPQTAQYSQLNLLKGYTTSMIYQQLRNTLQQDLDFTYDYENKKLYLYQQMPLTEQVTIVYNKEYNSVEDIKDPFWINLLFRLSLAYVKQVLGRVRSKYRMTSAPYELDGDTLLNEASTELSEIHAFLSENNNVFIPKD